MNNKRKAERLVRMLNDGYSGMKAVREVIALLEQWPDETEAAPAAQDDDMDDCAPNHLCKGRMVHLPTGEQCDWCGGEV